MFPEALLANADSWLDLLALLCASVGTLVFTVKDRGQRRRSAGQPEAAPDDTRR
jgi:hypothetical protein